MLLGWINMRHARWDNDSWLPIAGKTSGKTSGKHHLYQSESQSGLWSADVRETVCGQVAFTSQGKNKISTSVANLV